MIPLIILHLVLTAARPAAPVAKVAPVDTHALASVVLLPDAPRRRAEVILPVEAPISPRLHLLSLALAQADIAETIHVGQRGEQDIFARPITSLPKPGYEAAGMGLALALNLLAEQANHSPRFHRFARPMLYAQIAGNAIGVSYTVAASHHH